MVPHTRQSEGSPHMRALRGREGGEGEEGCNGTPIMGDIRGKERGKIAATETGGGGRNGAAQCGAGTSPSSTVWNNTLGTAELRGRRLGETLWGGTT